MALTQKQANEVKEIIFGGFVADGFTVEGRTKEGLALTNDNGDCIVVKIIAKKDDFDLADAIAEFEEAEANRLEKEAKAEAKRKEKEAKKKEA